MLGKEFEYIMSISETLEAGIWVAVVDSDVIKGKNAKEVFQKSREKYPKKEPFIMKVPDNSCMLL